jgi:hypothetical protein
VIAPPDKRARHTARQAERTPLRWRHGVTPLWADIPAFTAFSQEVEEAFSETGCALLSYSKRQALLKRAAHFGIRPFDASLIIAMVQDRASRAGAASSSADSEVDYEPGSRRSWPATLAIFLTIQAVILALGWLALRPLF